MKTYGKSQKQVKKKRRLPVGELTTVSERPGTSDVEVTDSEFSDVAHETGH
jgi:hypothetical protein